MHPRRWRIAVLYLDWMIHGGVGWFAYIHCHSESCSGIRGVCVVRGRNSRIRGGFPVAEKPQEILPVPGLYDPSEQACEGGVKCTGRAEAWRLWQCVQMC